MPASSSFIARSIPYERIEKLAISDGYSWIYPADQPNVPIVGEWRTRHCSLADSFQPILNRLHDFTVREDDVWIVTSPKCGTTWAQEMTWCIMNNFDFDIANAIDLTIRSPFLEFNGVVPNVPHDTIEAANAMPSPRLIKSHLPAWLLPKQIWTKQPKIIYVFRNPKDAAISYFHHWRGMVGYQGSKEEFMRSYSDGCVNFTPFWPHVLDFWQLRHCGNVFFTSYERMKMDLPAVITDVCHFLDKDISKAQMHGLTEHLSFERMRNNPACNHVKEFESMKAAAGRDITEFRFVRRGIVGSHKDEMPSSVVQEFDRWTEDNLNQYNLSVNDFINYSKY